MYTYTETYWSYVINIYMYLTLLIWLVQCIEYIDFADIVKK
jgi:hypothetical protein